MTTTNTISSTPNTAIAVETTRTRTAARTGTARFRQVLEDGATVVMQGVESAAGLMPGSPVVSAAVRGVRQGANPGSGASAEGPGGTSGSSTEALSAVLDSNGSSAMEMLALQQRISDEQRQFTTVSNVMKARHDSAKQVIGNLR